jgi:hypothetical protein
MAAREVLDSVGGGQKYCNQILGKAITVGNNLGLPEPALRDTCKHTEVCTFRCIRAHGPTNAILMKDFAIADQTINMCT